MERKFFNTHNFYLASLGAKALNGLFEIVGAIFILATDFGRWPGYINVIFRKELIEDPNDIVANLFLDTMQKLDISIQLSGFLYLMSHGLVKLILVVSLLKKKYWAYPVSEFILFLFIIYQTYLYARNGSTFILLLNAIDIILIALIWLEYKKLKAQHGETK